LKVAHIGRAGQPFQPALIVERVLDLLHRKPQRARQEPEHAGIYVSRTGSHHQSLERCHAHRTVHAVPTIDSTDAGPVSKMDAYQLEIGKWSPDFVRGPLGDVF